MKDNTTPLDLILHSDVRAVERAEFDNHVSFLFIYNIRFNY